MEFSRGERAVLWLEAHSPRFLLEAPERVLLNLALLVIGVTTFLPPPPGNVLETFPTVGRMVLGGIMITGAAVSILGSVKMDRQADRFGAIALGSVCLLFSLLLFGEAGLRALLTGIIFFFIALAKLFRWVRATAYRIRTRHHLEAVKDKMEKDGEL